MRTSMKRFAAGLIGCLLVLPQGLRAQTVSTEELIETIKKLEARVAELEKANKPSQPGPAAAAPPESSEAAVAEVKKEVEEVKKQQADAAPVLSFFKSKPHEGPVQAESPKARSFVRGMHAGSQRTEHHIWQLADGNSEDTTVGLFPVCVSCLEVLRRLSVRGYQVVY